MKRSVILVAALAVSGLLVLVAARWVIVRISPRPSDLGDQDGRLAPCPDTPNCVSSQATDATHAIDPLPFTGETGATRARILAIIEATPRTRLIASEDDYIYAEFRTFGLEFIDDVEFYLDDTAGLVHIRSASRIGTSDFGVNRARMERIRTSFLRR